VETSLIDKRLSIISTVLIVLFSSLILYSVSYGSNGSIQPIPDSEYLDRFIESNETSMLSTLRLFQTQHRQSIIEKNREVVEEVYSQESIGVRLYKAITSQIEELNRNGWE